MKKRVIYSLLIGSLTCFCLGGCSFRENELYNSQYIQEKIDIFRDWFWKQISQQANQSSIDLELNNDEPIFLGEVSVGGVDLAEGEVGYLD